jgi:hypothetical protein
LNSVSVSFRSAREERTAGGGHVVDGGIERRLIGARWLAEAADLAHELERSLVQLLLSRWPVWIP